MRQPALALASTTVLAALLIATPAFAQADHSAAGKEYSTAMDKMHKDMMTGMDADPTKAWAKMMIPHHQGAIDMSKTVLKHTKDDEIQKKAEKVIKDQTQEIEDLQAWLKKSGR